jgi:Tfp pilus assembly protein PilF
MEVVLPIERLSSADAFGRLRLNPDSRYPSGRGTTARLTGVATVGSDPSFSFSAADPIMTIGSCFAREIEKRLTDLGFDLPMTKLEFPREERASETANDSLNKYTVHSMVQEVRWAFEAPKAPWTDIFLSMEDDRWHDPHLSANLIPGSFDRILERRQEVAAAMREISRCKVIIVTLGLAEAWYDTRVGYYLNGAPPAECARREPERFVLDVLGHDEILAGLEDLHATISRFGRPDFRILITVSPVPFKATFTGQDALIANTYSKCVQRAACEVFVRRHENVDYFPSYELVTLTDRTMAYEVDNIHVRPALVAKIMDTVVSRYCQGGSTRASAEDLVKGLTGRTAKATAVEVAGRAYRERNYPLAIQIYQFVLRNHSTSMDFMEQSRIEAQYGVSLLRNGQPAEGVEVLRRALALDPTNARILYKLGLGLARSGRREEAVQKFRLAIGQDPNVPDYHWRLGLELRQAGRHSEAKTSAEQALALNPEHAGSVEFLRRSALKDAVIKEPAS